MKLKLSPALPAALALCLCSLPAVAASKAAPANPVDAALKKIDADRVLEYITALASDEFEGRAPGTHGETVTIDYLQQQFKKLGLEPGNPDGTYLQAVPLVGVSSHPIASYTVKGQRTALKFPDDYVAWTARTERNIRVADSELVFVGYGVQAPEFNWDDYKGMDVKGKTLVMLINDPPVPDPRHPKELDPAVFGGKAMSYYGRWGYKFEMAARLGAAAALIVHETKAASYPFDVVRNSWGRENFTIQTRGQNPDFPAIPGWLQLDKAKEIFQAGGQDFDALKKAALSRDFKPVPLGVKINLEEQNSWRNVASNNVVARIAGSDPKLKNETIIYSAHWDHFGLDETLPGPRTQQIFHGALDNASGVAALLEVAKAYKALPVAPKRSILFVLTTAEERGLLGAQYYAKYPLYPLNKTLANINVDGLNLWGRTRTVELSGMGKSSLDEVAVAVAKAQGRTVRVDSNAEFGSFFRGDQFEFAKAGVPVLYLRPSGDFIGKPRNYARDKVLDYVAHHYHKVTDVVQPTWDLAGAVEDIALLFQAGYQIAQGADYPQWKDSAEFKAIRDKSLAAPAR
jgi:Zn-dependent M28 family amino/carboxypeptidase